MSGSRWTIRPESDPKSTCRSCGATIYWIVTKNGKKMPVNEDGTSHFSTCPQAEGWRRSQTADGASPSPTRGTSVTADGARGMRRG